MESLDSFGPKLHLPDSVDPLAKLGLSYAVISGKGIISAMDCIDIVLRAIRLPENEQGINLKTETCYASIERRGPDSVQDMYGQRYFARVITHQGQYQGLRVDSAIHSSMITNPHCCLRDNVVNWLAVASDGNGSIPTRYNLFLGIDAQLRIHRNGQIFWRHR